MKYHFYFGPAPSVSDLDPSDFSRGNFVCKALMETPNGQPVAISQCKFKEFPIWKVEHGFSCLVFATYEEAMDYCRGRFRSVKHRR